MAGNRQAGRASAAADIQNLCAPSWQRIDQQALEGHEEPVEHQLQIGPDMALRTAPAGRFGDVIVHEIVHDRHRVRPFCHFKLLRSRSGLFDIVPGRARGSGRPPLPLASW
jgi:hypothetical protein